MSDPGIGMRLHDDAGRRLYLNAAERRRFIDVARTKPTPVAALCLCLIYSGCRVSEGLALSPVHLQTEAGLLTIRSLKKRRAGHVREVPIPPELVGLLDALSSGDRRFWPIGRATAWRRVKAVMAEAQIAGPQATPKGLRHAFAVNAILCNVSLTVLQRWMGHADLATTAIYTRLSGAEEREMARWMW